MRFDKAARAQFAANLRAQRNLMGFSQEGLAQLCGLDRTTISLLERSQRSPTLDTIVVLARGLELGGAADLLDQIH